MAKQNNSDWMSEYQDKELERIEKDISSLYSNAAKEVDAEFAKFVDSSKQQLNEKLEQLDAGDITKTEYQVWVQKQMLQTDRYKATVDHMTDILVKSDKAAMAVVNGKLPTVVAESYNFSQALGFEAANKAGLSVGTFQVYNAKSVEKIIRDNPKLLKEVDVPEDKKWNQTKINREITTGLLKGESIPKVSERLRRVTDMDKNAATRNARTAMTAAENVGRNESAEELKAKGIPVEEVWSAAIDKRTRETHILLDGTVKDEDGFFGADILLHPLRYPADPDGDPEEIYNCRCRLNIQIKGIDHSNDKDLYERFMKQNDPDSYKRIREVDEPKEEAYQKNKERAEASLPARQERIRELRGQEQVEQIKQTKAKEPEFVPAQTVQEAQQRARDLGVPYTKFDGWDLERANNALDALERLPADCRPKAVLNGKDTSIITDRKIGRKSESWYGVTYDYRLFSLRTMQIGFDKTDYDGGQVVGINVQGFKTLGKLTQHKENDNQKYFEKTGRYWYFNTDGKATAHHEMGHCFYNERIFGKDNVRKEWEELSKKWSDSSNYDMIKKPEEAFAEAWAGYNLNDKRVPDYISDFIRRTL